MQEREILESQVSEMKMEVLLLPQLQEMVIGLLAFMQAIMAK